MRKPSAPGTAIDGHRFEGWKTDFAGYHSDVATATLDSWLNQFAPADRDLAARLLDAVVYLTPGHIRGIYRDILNNLPGWHRQKKHREGRWYFVPFSVRPGESGESMTHVFRLANAMGNRFFDSDFVYKSELLELDKMPGPDDTVVLIDDFSGTGRQACSFWNNSFQELLPKSPRVFLVLVAATIDAAKKIASETDMEPCPGITYGPKDNLFSDVCTRFTKGEKRTILDYCLKADGKFPKGYGDCGLLVVLSHQCPNNSISLLHSTNDNWYGVFPRC